MVLVDVIGAFHLNCLLVFFKVNCCIFYTSWCYNFTARHKGFVFALSMLCFRTRALMCVSCVHNCGFVSDESFNPGESGSEVAEE